MLGCVVRLNMQRQLENKKTIVEHQASKHSHIAHTPRATIAKIATKQILMCFLCSHPKPSLFAISDL